MAEGTPGHHGHGHSHQAGDERRTLVAFALTAGFMLVEAAGGLLSGSLALLADAAHMLTDAMALGLAWGAIRLGRMSADPQRSYGYRRLEVLAALINGLAVVAVSVWIAWEAALRLAHPQPVAGLPMLAVAAGGMAVNLIVLRVLGGHGQGGGRQASLNMRGAMLHVIGDLLGSGAAILAALVILATGWMAIDALLSVAVAGLILVGASRLVRAASHILLEGTPEGFEIDDVRRVLIESIDGLADVHHVHAWSLTGGAPLVTLHARLTDGADPDATLSAIKRELSHAFHVTHSVVQIERGAA
ncbi:MAG: cation transporter, partial [Alphaproteobacteria bacterium]|nr:cation transporter [Alphaproteobacteria bacterium]